MSTTVPLCLAFVDYEKAFDSIEFEPLFGGLKNQGIDEEYLNILQNLYSEAISVVRLYKDSENLGSLEEEPVRETTSLPNSLCHVCNMPSSIRSTGKTKVSGLMVNTSPTLFWPMI